ncbi:hypothetical protein [Streptomyces adelaidensis]|nr:hypothetical protein [Streptomyces adelaidensis]
MIVIALIATVAAWSLFLLGAYLLDTRSNAGRPPEKEPDRE